MVQQWECLSHTNEGQVRSRPSAICGFSLLLVLDLFQWFFSGFSGFPSSTKTNMSKFQFDQDSGPERNVARADAASRDPCMKSHASESYEC